MELVVLRVGSWVSREGGLRRNFEGRSTASRADRGDDEEEHRPRGFEEVPRPLPRAVERREVVHFLGRVVVDFEERGSNPRDRRVRRPDENEGKIRQHARHRTGDEAAHPPTQRGRLSPTVVQQNGNREDGKLREQNRDGREHASSDRAAAERALGAYRAATVRDGERLTTPFDRRGSTAMASSERNQRRRCIPAPLHSFQSLRGGRDLAPVFS
ncbi:hypothetical protein [Haladaptatus halobius]|uniref:hypothetical protein n=1 Tax=Haladaptatus halobius TaxID=2884875 RepID=UPI001D0A884B|nr:hypothetical protein [Haladaptatus halobius]